MSKLWNWIARAIAQELPPEPRVVRFNEHPWARRIYGRVVSGGATAGAMIVAVVRALWRGWVGCGEWALRMGGWHAYSFSLGAVGLVREIGAKLFDHGGAEFNARHGQFGGKGDGVVLSDAAITSGDATLTSASAAFVAADVGKAIMVKGAGTSGGALVTTIASRNSATSVELSATASTTVSGATAIYGSDDTTAIVAAEAAAVAAGGRVRIPHGNWIVTSKVAPTGHVELAGSMFKGTTICSFVDDYWLETTTSGKTVAIRNLKWRGTGSGASGGVNLFDNTDRVIELCEAFDFGSKAALRIVQTVNPIIRAYRAYGTAAICLEIDGGATTTVSPLLEGVYLGFASSAALKMDSVRGFVALGLIVEQSTVGFEATDSDGDLFGGWFEGNTADAAWHDSPITRHGTRSTSEETWNSTWSTTPANEQYQAQIHPAFGGHYTTDPRTLAATGTWTDVLMNVPYDAFRTSPNPGGAAFADLRVSRHGLYRITYTACVKNADAAAAHNVAFRLVAESTEIPGSYCAGTVPISGFQTFTMTCIASLATDDDISLQFQADDTDISIDGPTTGLTAPTADSLANVTVEFLMAQE